MKGQEQQRDERSGRYTEHIRCDGCGKAIKGEYTTDDRVCGGGDGPGFFLCGRAKCPGSDESLSVEKKRELFARQRAANEERQRTMLR